MTDYFALLDQPRRPWLDPDEVKQAFHHKTLHAHPDAHAHAGNADTAEAFFAQINEAYQVLAEPKRRLHHLLTLSGHPPPKSAAVPPEIANLFPVVAELIQSIEALSGKIDGATNPLSRSLLKPESLELQARLTAQLHELQALDRAATVRLQRITDIWRPDDAEVTAELHGLYLQFSYLTRWRDELEEKQACLRTS